jgi:glycerol-3-phosphate acyltransferase PlsY
MVKVVDIRQIGDGNAGAANAFCQLGARVGTAVFLIDVAKGALAVLIAQAANTPQVAVLLTGAAAVIGHNWSVFIAFRGGRGESTTIGVLLTLITQPMLIVGGAAIGTLFFTRNVILTSAVLFIPLPLVCWWLGGPGVLVGYSITLPCLVGGTHLLRTRQSVINQG